MTRDRSPTMDAFVAVDPGAAPEPVCPCCGGVVSPLDLFLDERTASIAFGGQLVRLTATQFRLVRALFDAYPRVLSKAELMDAVYPDPDQAPDVKIIDVLVCKIRPKLDPIGMTIVTQWGIGFALELAEDGKAALLRERRFAESRNRRLACDTPDLASITVYREMGYPITDIARRLNLTARAVMAGLDAIELAKASRPVLTGRGAA